MQFCVQFFVANVVDFCYLLIDATTRVLPMRGPNVIEDSTEFLRLMNELRDGCPKAMDRLCQEYSDAILCVVRRRLPREYRTQHDSVDFVQAVWASVIGEPPDLFTFTEPKQLVRYLARLATYKIIDVFRRRGSTQSDGPRELRLESPSGVPGREPSPSQNAIADERFQNLSAQLSPGQHRVLLMRRQGYTLKEIARELGVDAEAIRRIIRLIKRNLNP